MEDDDYFDGVDYFTKIEEMNLILGKEGEKKGNLYQGGIMAAESVQKLSKFQRRVTELQIQQIF